MNSNNLDINKLIQLLGAYKKCGNEYLFQCPYCLDKSKNNFSYNDKKHFLWCFASEGEHSKKFLKEVYNKIHPLPNLNQIITKTKPAPIFLSKDKIDKNFKYTISCNKFLLNNKEYLNIAFNKRKLNIQTIQDCLIGFDKNRKCFVFPSITFSQNQTIKIVGFEYRPSNLTKKGLYRQKGSLNGIMQINQFGLNMHNLIILGGYIDCYSFYQKLCKFNQEQFYHICTSSNGEPCTLKYLQEIEEFLSKYKNCYLCLDNDNIGIRTMQKIKEKYPFFEIINLPNNVKDFNELYVNNYININRF